MHYVRVFVLLDYIVNQKISTSNFFFVNDDIDGN